MDGRPRPTDFYTDDAARLASAAAERRAAPPAAPRVKLPDGPIIFSHRDRSPLKPQPASNQNDSPPSVDRRSIGLLRLFARVLIAPLYLGTFLLSIALIALVVRFAAHL